MPGIVGIIAKGSRKKNESDLNLMIDCMMHESFYTKGSYVNAQLGIYVGWVCHRGSFSDCMPVVNETKDIVLLFSGENFADKSVTEQLKRHGHEFDCSNAGYLVHLYEEKGESFLRELNGWFSGILVDLRKAQVILFNDRYGMQRVYYHEGKDAFLFASEAKSLLKIRPELRRIDMESLGQLISCDCVLQNRTLFSEVSLLPGGSAWAWHNKNGVRKNYYFKPSDWEGQPLLEEETFSARLKETFLKILPRYFHAEERIGMSLTGGLDSRMIMACLNLPPGAVSCYTFCGLQDMIDVSIARKVAEACHQNHSVIRLDRSFFSEFPRLAERTIYLSDGGLGIGSAHDIYFNRLAREIAPIRVTGKFGSEVIRDHTMFNATTLNEKLFHQDFRSYIQKGTETLSEMKKGHRLSVGLFREFPWRENSKLAIEQSQLTFRTPYMDNELVEVMYQAPAGVRASNEAQRGIIRDCKSPLSDIMTDQGVVSGTNSVFAKFAELYYYSLFKADYIYLFALPHWLTKLDSLCMSVNGGRQILGYQKFEYYRIWFRNELSDYIKEVLLDKQTAGRPYFAKDDLEQMVCKHIRGTHNYSTEINKAMTIELTHRLLIDT